MEERYIVTTYSDKKLDIDSVAAVNAYKEFITLCDKKSEVLLLNKLDDITINILKLYNLDVNTINIGQIKDSDNIVLIQKDKLSQEKIFNFDKVTEVISNNKGISISQFCNANYSFDKSTSLSLIVSKRLKEYNANISASVALLLYYGIYFATNKLDKKIINDKDTYVLSWIKTKCKDYDLENL